MAKKTTVKGLFASAALVIGVCFWPSQAHGAIEIWQSDDGLRSVEFSPSLKLFFFGAGGFLEEPAWFLEMDPSLRESYGFDQWPYPNVGGGMLSRIRLRFLADITSRIRFVVHYEHRPRVLSHGRILTAASSSLQGDETVPYRIYPMLWTITDSRVQPTGFDSLYGPEESTFAWEHEIDRLFFSFSLPRVDITIGRQAIGWGFGRLWSPLDVFAPLTATDIDREEKRGIDALRFTFSFSPTSLMEVVVTAGTRVDSDGDDVIAWSASALAWMIRWTMWDIEWMLMAAKMGTDEVVGGGISGQIRGVGVRGSVTSTTDQSNDTNVRATAGIEFGTRIGLTGIIEYHYNGFGTIHTNEYMDVALEVAERLSQGQISGLAQHYAGLTLMYQPVSVLTLSMIYLQNCQDGSLVLGPSIEYSVSDEVRLNFSAFIPIGRDAEWDTSGAIPELVPRSEYGMGSQLYMLQLRVNI